MQHRRFENIDLALIAGSIDKHILNKYLFNRTEFDKLLDVINYNDFNNDVENVMTIYKKRTWKSLLEIETRWIQKGEYQKAYYIRKISQKCAMLYFERGHVISNSFLLAWSFAIEGDIDQAELIINNELERVHCKVNKEKLDVLKRIFNGRIGSSIINRDCIYDLSIENKAIRVVGPLSEDIKNNNSEIIVRINSTEENNGKVNISFYNGEVLKEIGEGKRNIPAIDYYVFHRFMYDFQDKLINQNKAKLTFHCDYIMGLGQPNMLPNVLFHVLALSPSSIFVNGFNLYMSREVYVNSYLGKTDEERSIHKLKNNFSQHNIISQYQFISFLYKQGLIIPDELLKEIFEKGIEWYLANLERFTRLG